jgi:hypothetical protein
LLAELYRGTAKVPCPRAGASASIRRRHPLDQLESNLSPISAEHQRKRATRKPETPRRINRIDNLRYLDTGHRFDPGRAHFVRVSDSIDCSPFQISCIADSSKTTSQSDSN